MNAGGEDIDDLRNSVSACRICRDHPAKSRSPLPHEPRPVISLSGTARVLIAGQAPGLRVHESGIPFNDSSGDRLRDWLAVTRDEFYDPGRFAILPMGFCFPGYDNAGSDLPPRSECAPFWRARILAAMPQTELILVIGQYAQAWHLGKRRHKNLTETVSHWRDYLMANNTPLMLPLPHPSWRNTGWLRKNPWFDSEVLPVLRQQVDQLIRGK